MLKTILSISGKPGLYKLVSHGKNMLIVESLTDNKRVPAYAKEQGRGKNRLFGTFQSHDRPIACVLCRGIA